MKLVADSQYSNKAFREKCIKKGIEPIVPYPANQMKGKKGLFRVDRKFRVRYSVNKLFMRGGQFWPISGPRTKLD